MTANRIVDSSSPTGRDRGDGIGIVVPAENQEQSDTIGGQEHMRFKPMDVICSSCQIGYR
jgi:hypothetical protein